MSVGGKGRGEDSYQRDDGGLGQGEEQGRPRSEEGQGGRGGKTKVGKVGKEGKSEVGRGGKGKRGGSGDHDEGRKDQTSIEASVEEGDEGETTSGFGPGEGCKNDKRETEFVNHTSHVYSIRTEKIDTEKTRSAPSDSSPTA